MTVVDAASRYDQYWTERDLARTRARSRGRAAIAFDLLRGVRSARGEEVSSGELLEVGCGPGFALEVFTEAGFSARGVDVSSEAARQAADRGLRVERADVEAGDLDGQCYDLIAAFEVLEHLVDPLTALQRLHRLLKTGGLLLISLPNEFHVLRRLSILIGRPGFGGHEDPHLRYFDDFSARRLFEAAGLRVLAQASDSVVPPRRSWLRAMTRPFQVVFPRLLSISNVYVLEAVQSGEPATEGGAA